MLYRIDPVAKPRMTARDKWKQRPAVIKYRTFCDLARLLKIKVPAAGAHIVFHVPMPRSWSQKKQNQLDCQPHQQRPDVDNYLKALLDALFEEDSHVHDIRVSKIWALTGAIEVKETPVL